MLPTNTRFTTTTRVATVTFAISILILVLAGAIAQSNTPWSLWTSLDSDSSDNKVAAAAARIFSPFRSLSVLTRSFSGAARGEMAKRTPVYFVSHGGPDTMFNTEHPVYPQLQRIGREITQQVKPSAIVVFSAHWQADRPNTIEVNVAEDEPLLYDFYGFPRSYYQEKFPNKGSAKLAQQVIDALSEHGIKTQKAERGLDHGVFVPFKVMFNPDTNPVTVPIVQVSLFDDHTDAAAHIRLGRAVQKLREENVLIICSGMSVHNLRHLMMMGRGSNRTMPYAVTFDEALKVAVETKPGEQRDEAMNELLERDDARQAHPTFEHLLPIHIAVGASGTDQGKQLWTMQEASMGWAQFRFGEVEA
ncbi:4,5-DOPA dioxygenase extradiol-like protein [Fonsecaea pedrosoi]|nr:4,5-DOPA dioxygenase extradiol-like protein [Fonsecaea pedrosoi]